MTKVLFKPIKFSKLRQIVCVFKARKCFNVCRSFCKVCEWYVWKTLNLSCFVAYSSMKNVAAE